MSLGCSVLSQTLLVKLVPSRCDRLLRSMSPFMAPKGPLPMLPSPLFAFRGRVAVEPEDHCPLLFCVERGSVARFRAWPPLVV